MAHPRVAICVPSGDTWMAKMAISLVALTAHACHYAALMPITVAGADTVEGRNSMADFVLERGAEWLLWIDNDMVFPPDSLKRLLAHEKDFVGAEYRKRVPPYEPSGNFGAPIAPEATGLIERPLIGLGLTLISANVFKALAKPYFLRMWQANFATEENPRGFTTEDTFICAMARNAGFTVYCDMDLTREVSHLAVTPIGWDLSGMTQTKTEVRACE